MISVAGTKNEQLTVSGLTASLYDKYFIKGARSNYWIDSNEATLITLEDRTTSYPDLTGETIDIYTPSDYFIKDEEGNYPELVSLLRINVSGSLVTNISNRDIDNILILIEEMLHERLNLSSPIPESNGEVFQLMRKALVFYVNDFNKTRQNNTRTKQTASTLEFAPDFSIIEINRLLQILSDQSNVFDMIHSYGDRIY